MKPKGNIENGPYKGEDPFFPCGKIEYMHDKEKEIEKRNYAKDFIMYYHD